MIQKQGFKETEIGIIPVDWAINLFADVVNVNPKRILKKGTTAKHVSMSDINEHDKKIKTYSAKQFKGGSKFHNKDTLMARITPCLENGKTAFVDMLNENDVGFGSTEFIVLSGKKGQTTNEFVYYLSRYSKVRDMAIKSMVGTSGRQRVRNDVFNRLKIALPSIPEQKAIVKHFSDLDDKIALNNQINQTLESMAQAIFKSWCVDFDPVKAKIAALESGEDAEGVTRAAMRTISGKTDDELDKMEGGRAEDYAKLKATAGLFPAVMEDSELGEVPEGWEVSSIGAEFNATMGQSPPGSTYNENGDGEPFFQGRRDFGWRYPENRVYCTQPKRMAKKGDTLLSVRAPVGDINKAVSDCCIGRGIAALRHKSGCEAYTYYSMMDLSRNLKSFDSEGTVFGSINQKDLKALKILKPPNSLVKIFTHTVGTLDQQILNFEYQIRVLSRLRDTILPKLMSGTIRTKMVI